MTGCVASHPSFVHALLANAERGSDAARTVFALSGAERVELRHDVLAQEALATAAVLKEAGVRPGDRVIVCLPTSPEFVTAFFGIAMLGAVPIAVAMPSRMTGPDRFQANYRQLQAYLRPRAVVATSHAIAATDGESKDGSVVIDGAELRMTAQRSEAVTAPVLPNGDAYAFLQLTSGSTGSPRAVVVSHGNLAANCRQFGEASRWAAGDVQVAWLPLNHDMGLVGALLAPIFHGTDALLMPPERFLRAPSDWLRAISDYGGTLSAAPNFAVSYTTTRVRDDELDGVDLSSLRFVFCGAEPIDPATLHGFVRRFAAWGLRSDVLVPCYGLAEATLAVTVGRPEFPVRYDAVTPDSLTAHSTVDAQQTKVMTRQLVNCGAPLAGTELRIVDDTGTLLADGTLGRIQFRGPSRTVGYYRRPQHTTAALDQEGWWDTGDLGYLRDDELRVAGRVKDVIIIRGVNYFPTDFERVTETVSGVRLGRVAAVSLYDESAGSEALHIIAESELGVEQHCELKRQIVAAVTRRCGIAPAAVHLVPSGAIQKTTSGKVKRLEARRLLLQGNEPAGRSFNE